MISVALRAAVFLVSTGIWLYVWRVAQNNWWKWWSFPLYLAETVAFWELCWRVSIHRV